MSFEIVLDAGTQDVPTADIPGLIAAALHPDASGVPLTVSYFIKTAKPGATGTAANWRGQPIDEAEAKLLAELWADMPPLPSNATEDQIRPYIAAFREKGAHLEWELGVVWNNPELNAGMLRIQAEVEHRKGINADIRAGKLAVIDPVSRRPTSEAHPASIVRVEELRRYVEQWDVSLRVADPAPEEITVQDLALEIARGAAERHADQWSKPGRDNALRGDIAAAMNVHGWQSDGIPSVVQHIRNMVEMGVVGFGPIEVRSRFNGLPPTDPEEIKANPANWLISREHAEIVRRALAVEAARPNPPPDGYALAAYRKEFGQQDSEKWTREQWNRVAVECKVLPDTLLTIGDAANLVGHKFGWHDQAIKTLANQLMSAVTVGTLTVRHPHTDLPYAPQRVSWYYEMVRADELDTWFELQKIPQRIQSATDGGAMGESAGSAVRATKPVQRSQAQAAYILQALRDAGYDPLNLPAVRSGQRGDVKSEIRTLATSTRRDIFQSANVFDSAWERLSVASEIRRTKTAP